MTTVLVKDESEQADFYSAVDISVPKNHGKCFLSKVSGTVFIVTYNNLNDVVSLFKIGSTDPVCNTDSLGWKNEKIFREIKSLSITINEFADRS